jgi:hypothetical protein
LSPRSDGSPLHRRFNRNFFLVARLGADEHWRSVFIRSQAMNSHFYEICLVVFAVLLAGIVGLAFTRGPRSKATEDRKPRSLRIARQPWDAESADGRGNR